MKRSVLAGMMKRIIVVMIGDGLKIHIQGEGEMRARANRDDNLVYRGKRHMSHHLRKSTICIGENKAADQLCSNCTADQRLCFRCTDSTILLLFKSEILSF